MHPITTVGQNVARRLRVWRNPSRLCFPPRGPRPLLRLNPSLAREQHDSAHPQAPSLPSRPHQDVQQPLPFGEEPKPPLQDTKPNTGDSIAGPAQEVPQQSSQTTVADESGAHLASRPFVCDECGVKFRYETALHRHQEYHGQRGGCKTRYSAAGMKVKPHVLKSQDPRDLKLTTGLGKKIFEVSSRELEPSPVAVSGDSGYQVVSTFDTIKGTKSPISVPGSPPVWKDPELPMRLPEAPLRSIHPRDQVQSRFDLLLLSAHATPSEFRSNEVDIVTHTSLLAELLEFCKGKIKGSTRMSLRMIQGSLFVAADSFAYGHSPDQKPSPKSVLRDHCTETAPGLEHSIHYRSVQYRLGHVNCVVQHQVDALHATRPGELSPSSPPSPVEPVESRVSHPQSQVALVSLHRQGTSAISLPHRDLWFSRAPVHLKARLSRKGTITHVSKIDATAEAGQWERKDHIQVALRKLATLLSELKGAVEAAAPDGQECVGLLERRQDPSTIQLFLSEDESKMGLGDISKSPWVGKTSHEPDDASEAERQGPTSQA